MNETTAPVSQTAGKIGAGKIDRVLQRRLDELARGECTEEEFVDEISSLLRAAPSEAWNILVEIHQRYVHGELSADFFRARATTVATSLT